MFNTFVEKMNAMFSFTSAPQIDRRKSILNILAKNKDKVKKIR